MTGKTAHEAVRRWAIDISSMSLAAHRENTVYAATTTDGRKFALRSHRPGYHSPVELKSELTWMSALAERGVRVPLPVMSKSGKHIEEVDGEYFDLLSWLPGKPMGKAGTLLDLPDRLATFYDLGTALAHLHGASDSWSAPPGFSRHAWDENGLLGEKPFWGRFWENPDLSRFDRDLLFSARQLAQIKLRRISSHLDYGLIHADPVRENVLIDGDRVQIIDFDDGGYGYRLFDLATVLLKCRSEPDYGLLNEKLQAGYHSVRELDVTHLPFLIALRSFTYIGWIMSRSTEPWAPARLGSFKSDALHFANEVIANPDWTGPE